MILSHLITVGGVEPVFSNPGSEWPCISYFGGNPTGLFRPFFGGVFREIALLSRSGQRTILR